MDIEHDATTAHATAAAAAAATVDRLARIETKLDGFRLDADKVAVELRSQDARLERVERFMWLAVGMAFASGIPDAARMIAGATA